MRHTLRFALLSMGLIFSATACSGGGQGKLSEEDLAGTALVEGAKVRAARGNKKNKQKSTVLGQYGKLAKLRFADANIGWVDVKTIEPAGIVQRYPEGDKCGNAVDDKVLAPWSTSRSMFKGTVDEVHGKMAHIAYDDGDADWAECEKLKEPKTPSATNTTKTKTNNTDGTSAATKCKRGCNKACRGASNKSKCVSACRRRCDGK